MHFIGTIGMTELSKFQKALIYLMPVGSLIITYSFPSALCLYWCTANFHSLLTAYILKIERVRIYMNLPEQVEEDKNTREATLSSIIKFKDTVLGEEAY